MPERTTGIRVLKVECKVSRADSAAMRRLDRRLAFVAIAGAALLAVAIPVLGAQPSGGPPGQADKVDREPAEPVSVTGRVAKATDADGRPTYTVTAGGKTWTLSAGPSWFWGDGHPLEAFVGKNVVIAGEARPGETELDVQSVDGLALRAPGKPPWAGGPWVVGESHPGWKDWMADGKRGNGHGREGAPGQLKKVATEP